MIAGGARLGGCGFINHQSSIVNHPLIHAIDENGTNS
jgi:hypothetical protein